MTELSRLTRLSRQHVHQAVTEALNRGYIVKVDAGCFDSDGGKDSRPATYGIREQGLINPLVVEVVDGGRYRLIAGERRFAACRGLGSAAAPASFAPWPNIPASPCKSLRTSIINKKPDTYTRSGRTPIQEETNFKILK